MPYPLPHPLSDCEGRGRRETRADPPAHISAMLFRSHLFASATHAPGARAEESPRVCS